MNNTMITIPYADAIEYGENTSALFKALWELTDLIRLESDLKKHHRAYLHVREDIDEKVKEARQIMTKVSVDMIGFYFKVDVPESSNSDENPPFADAADDEAVSIPKDKYELMIGQSSTEAERKRAARLENKALLPPRTKGGHLSDIRPPEIEIELEKEIEIEKEREGETGHPTPAAYGRYNNVILTDTELSGLKTELPDKWEYYIDRLSCHIASTGKQYHSHAATIYKWAQEDAAKGKAAPKQGIPDYSCKEGESL